RCCDRARRDQVVSKPHREGAPAYRGQGPEQLCGVVLMATLSYLRDCFGRDPSMLRSVTARRGSRKGFSYRRLPFAVKTLLDGDVRHRRGWLGPCHLHGIAPPLYPAHASSDDERGTVHGAL